MVKENGVVRERCGEGNVWWRGRWWDRGMCGGGDGVVGTMVVLVREVETVEGVAIVVRMVEEVNWW